MWKVVEDMRGGVGGGVWLGRVGKRKKESDKSVIEVKRKME